MNVHSMITQCRREVFRSGMANGHCGKQCIEVASTYLSPCKVWKKFSTFIFQLSGWALVVPCVLHCTVTDFCFVSTVIGVGTKL